MQAMQSAPSVRATGMDYRVRITASAFDSHEKYYIGHHQIEIAETNRATRQHIRVTASRNYAH